MSSNQPGRSKIAPPVFGAGLAVTLFAVIIHFLSSGSASPGSSDWGFGTSAIRHRLGEGWGISHWDAPGRRVGIPAARGAKTVLIVGDSFVESLQVNDDETFAVRAQTLLPGIRTINAGRGGASPADYVLQAPELRRELRPVWTVIELQPDDLEGDSFQPVKAHFVETGTTLTPVAVPPRFGRSSEMLRQVRSHSSLLNLAIYRWSAFRNTAKLPPLFLAAGGRRRIAPEAVPAARNWPVEQELEMLRAAYDGRVTFLLLPPFEAVPPPTERRFRAYCVSRGTSCVDFRTAFAGFRAAGDAPYGFPNSGFGTGHLNTRGHLAVAQLLARELSEVRRRGLF